jgi:alpha-glucosidase
VLQRRSGRFVLRLEGGLRADLGPAPAGRLDARRTRVAARFRTPAGKRRVHRLTGRALTVAGVEVRAYADGIAFRARGADARLRTPPGTRAWLQRYTGAYERPYRRANRPRGRYAFPALLRHRGRYTLLTESGVARDAVSHLHAGGRTLRVDIARGQERPRRGLWRVAVTGTLATVVESDLPLALGRPSKIRDTSWIEPGRAAWSWLSDRSSPQREDAQRQYVDLAARMGWEYVTVDEGWDPAWVAELADYAAQRGVKVILWYDQADLSRAVVRRAARRGIAGIKADFFHSDSAENIARMDDIARWAAERRLVVAFHGSTIPRGLQRTWPNVLTVEAVRGAEYGTQPRRDVINAALVRGPVGSTDFTPPGDAALAIVFESGLQHFGSDGPLLDEIPAAWDETRLLAGAPDRHVVVARRSGRRWFLGGIARGAVEFPLPPGRYTARFADGSEREVSGRMRAAGDVAAILTPAG